MITEQLHSLGAWSVTLADETPRAITDLLCFFGHIAIWRGRVDVELTADATLLSSARYVGVLREKPEGRTSLEGAGMVYWLGDEDHKGPVLEQPVVFSAASLTDCVTTLLPPSVTVGTIHDPGGTYSGTHQWQTPRDVLDTICAAFGVEYRVNGDASVDVGTQAQLYGTTATTIISARGAGNDFDLTSLGADFKTGTAVLDYTSRTVLLGQKTDSAGTSTSFVEATADADVFPYKDLRGNPVHVTRMISDAGQTDASAPAAAQLQLNQFNRTKTALTITATEYDMSSEAVVGQNAYVFDPDNGLVDPATQVDFRGELLFPVLIRIAALQWPVTDGHTVAFRTQDGEWIDLTRWVQWETQSESITVGDLPRTLTSSSNPVLDQANSAPDATTPGAPTGLTLTTTSVESSVGQSTATITASWTAPATNTDGSVITDLSHYLVRYRWAGRAPLWDTRIAPTTTIDIPGLAVGLVYDVEVAAVDTTGHVSAYTAVESITAAPDQTAPNPPSDPVVTSYLGQLRIAWDGKDNTGAAMPPDFAIVEVHVSATSGFTPVGGPGSATLVSELSTAGVAYATAPYGAARYVKLVAVDNSFNRSAPSGQVSGATTQVADGDIASLSVGKLVSGTGTFDLVVAGQITTALTGGRTVFNALGFQKFASDGVTKMIDFTGTQNLLTGTLQTALTGRRIVTGAAGTTGEIDFYAPDGTQTVMRAFTESTGVESIQFGVPIAANAGQPKDFLWNRWHANSDEWAQLRSNKVDFMFGAATGFFVVRQTTDRGQTNIGRMSIDSVGSYGRFLVIDTNGKTRLQIDQGFSVWDTLQHERLSLTDTGLAYWEQSGTNRIFLDDTNAMFYVMGNGTDVLMSYAYNGGDFHLSFGSGGGDFIIHNQATFPLQQMFNGDGTGIGLHSFHDSRGVSFEIRQWDDSSYVITRAASFEVNSDARSKAGIAEFDGDALALIRPVKPRTYQRDRPVPNKNGGTTSGTPVTELGLLAQEAPDLIRRLFRDDGSDLGIDLYAMASLEWRGLQQLDARLTALDARLTALEGATP